MSGSMHRPQLTETPEIRDMWRDLALDEYLKAEIEFTDDFAAAVALPHADWKSFARSSQNWAAMCFLSPLIYAVSDWQETLQPGSGLRRFSPDPEDDHLQEPDDLVEDPSYEEHWSPSTLYRWCVTVVLFTMTPRTYRFVEDFFTLIRIYLNWKDCPAQLHTDLRDDLVLRLFRTQHYDFEFFPPDLEAAYPLDASVDFELGLDRTFLKLTTENDEAEPRPNWIHCLPLELLWYILILAHDGILYFPLIMTHVDSRFRTATQSISKLWATIDINLPPPIVIMYLQHSNQELLDVRMDIFSGRFESNKVQTFIDLVGVHRHRIATLSMTAFRRDTDVDRMVEKMLSEHQTEFSQLRVLHTGLVGPLPGWSNERLQKPVLIPQHVRDLHLRGFRTRDWTQGFSMSLLSIRKFHLSHYPNLDEADLAVVLPQLPSIETLIIECCYSVNFQLNVNGGLPDLPQVALPTLKSIQYISLPTLLCRRLGRMIISNGLTSAKLWFGHGHRRWADNGPIVVELLRGNPGIENLDISQCPTHPDSWRDIFHRAISVKYLLLRGCELENEDLQSLCEPTVVPHLEHIALECTGELTSLNLKEIVKRRFGVEHHATNSWYPSRVMEEHMQDIENAVGNLTPLTWDVEYTDSDGDNDEDSSCFSDLSWTSGDAEVVEAQEVIRRYNPVAGLV